MIPVRIRFPDVIVAHVKKLSREQKVTEAVIWRNLVVKGLQQEESSSEEIKLLLRMVTENLCISRRAQGARDPSVITNAREDTKAILEHLGI